MPTATAARAKPGARIIPTTQDNAALVKYTLSILRKYADSFYPRIATRYCINAQRAAFSMSENGEIHDHLSLEDEELAALTKFGSLNGNQRMLQAVEWCDRCDKFILGSNLCDSCQTCLRHQNECPSCDSCAGECCECANRCPECRETTRPICRNCGNCVGRENCCECPRCSACGEPSWDGCDGEVHCQTHCRCNEDSDSNEPVKIWEDGERLVGLEVEFNTATSLDPIYKWAGKWGAQLQLDGSCGWEMCTSPASGKHLSEQVREMGELITKLGIVANENCGVHVHVDARDLDLTHLRNLAYLYGKLEPIMYAVGGQQRAMGRWCRPNGAAMLEAAVSEKDWHKKLFTAIYCNKNASEGTYYRPQLGSIDAEKWTEHSLIASTGKKGGNRYVGMNMSPWMAGKVRKTKDTTVEFRIHKNCLDVVHLLNWARFCAKLMDFAVSHTWEETIALPADATDILPHIVTEAGVRWIKGKILNWKKSSTESRTLSYSKEGGWKMLA
jgi:hypothetical protein